MKTADGIIIGIAALATIAGAAYVCWWYANDQRFHQPAIIKNDEPKQYAEVIQGPTFGPVGSIHF